MVNQEGVNDNCDDRETNLPIFSTLKKATRMDYCIFDLPKVINFLKNLLIWIIFVWYFDHKYYINIKTRRLAILLMEF